MAFIIEQQARFEENIARQEKQSRENTVNIAKLADVILSFDECRSTPRHWIVWTARSQN